jgi:tetratricopeptide (TPR) repeat protein
MSPPDAWTTCYERGIAHHKRGEYAQAVVAYTEAIRLDPDAPNAYVRRSLSYRALGDDPRSDEDERAARQLGGAERTAWERLVNRSRLRWGWDLGNPAWRQTDPLSHKAVLLEKLNGQILNGGLRQWVANGYGRWIDDAIQAAREVDTDATREVAEALGELAPHLESLSVEEEDFEEEPPEAEGDGLEAGAVGDYHPGEEDDAFNPIGLCEDRFYRVQSRFVEDVRTWLEEKAKARP